MARRKKDTKYKCPDCGNAITKSQGFFCFSCGKPKKVNKKLKEFEEK